MATEKAEEWKWKVEGAARTLREFFKIKKNPKLHKAAIAQLKKERSERTEAINSLN